MAINERLGVSDSISFTIKKGKEIVNGKVAVLYAPGFGAGWYTWHDQEQLIFDPVVVAMVEEKNALSPDAPEKIYEIVKKIMDYCRENYDPEKYYGGAEDLVVEWLDVDTKFYIDEYDGAECLRKMDEISWITA